MKRQANDLNAWLTYCHQYLFDNPLCIRCKDFDLDEPAAHVHHIIPLTINELTYWETSNHVALCNQCKTVLDKKLKGGHVNHEFGKG
ncbi:HNH endonuclease [Thalassotalea sp. SU-HH00458]|uniref:HNH endonuclease n=1 Tax=Thalassotalea sp. SU-HH00458 TaxID=3127657 RepID=UPI00310B8BB0